MIWTKLHQTKGKPVYICSFYRPPGSSCETLHCLRESLYKIVNREGSSCRIVLAEDFNFPDIYWEDGVGCIRTNPAYGCECKELFLDLLNDFALEQQVKEPTRGTRILDLVLSLQPQLISNVSVIPGMSDHEAITFQLNLSMSKLHSDHYHKVYQYHKANQLSIKEEMERYKEIFLSSDPYKQTVEENWSNLSK